MFRMDEGQLEELLERNPELSISTHSVSHTISGIKADEEPAKNKYRNCAVYVFDDGYVFDTSLFSLSRKKIAQTVKEHVSQHGPVSAIYDSKKEYSRYKELQVMERTGKISNLERQVPLVIQEAVNYRDEHIRPIVYNADFRYEEDGEVVIEDVKGFDKKTGKWLTTQVFNLKWKLLKAKYPSFRFVLF